MQDLIVKTRNVRDEESIEMPEYVIRERVFDFANFYSIADSSDYIKWIAAKKDGFASLLEKTEKAAQKAADRITEKYRALE